MTEILNTIEHALRSWGVDEYAVSLLGHAAILVAIALIAWLSDFICRRIFTPLLLKVTNKTDVKWDDELFNIKVLTAACHIVPALIVYYMLPFAFGDIRVVLELTQRLASIYITITSIRLILTFCNSLKSLDNGHRSSSRQYIISIISVLKILVIFGAVIIIAAIIINKNPLTLFAGLGATATILMLVFKDTIVGLVSGIRLTSNDMVHKGDWITFEKAGANGIVEEITLTTVKIRNFDNTIVTVPPQTLVDDSFQNWKGMQKSKGRRVKRLVYFDFRSIGFIDDKQKMMLNKYFSEDELKGNMVNMTLFRLYIEKWLSTRQEVNTEMMMMVRQLEATNTGLPMEFYFFLKNKEWTPYEHDLATIMEQIYAMAPTFGLKIYQQYPEQ
jgi:miniconductance mechanosensitive channel